MRRSTAHSCKAAILSAAGLILLISALLLASPAVAQLASSNRVEVNAMEYPWSAIGRVNAGGRAHCTGFLISERHVITAAHCLYDPVVGRWRGAIELHFIAGYQRDRYILHSKVASYSRPENFTFSARQTLEAAAGDWAVLTLARPLGRQAGWLGLRTLDSLMLSRISTGDALLLQAGYRRDSSHIMTAGWGCRISGVTQGGRILLHDCDVVQGDSGSPLLLFADGEVHATGLHSIDVVTKDKRRLAGVLSLGVFHPKGGRPDAMRALAATSARWIPGQPPAEDSAAARVPLTTIDSLLAKLGHLGRSGAQPSASERASALRRFSAENGLGTGDRPSLEIMGHLLHATTP